MDNRFDLMDNGLCGQTLNIGDVILSNGKDP